MVCVVGLKKFIDTGITQRLETQLMDISGSSSVRSVAFAEAAPMFRDVLREHDHVALRNVLVQKDRKKRARDADECDNGFEVKLTEKTKIEVLQPISFAVSRSCIEDVKTMYVHTRAVVVVIKYPPVLKASVEVFPCKVKDQTGILNLYFDGHCEVGDIVYVDGTLAVERENNVVYVTRMTKVTNQSELKEFESLDKGDAAKYEDDFHTRNIQNVPPPPECTIGNMCKVNVGEMCKFAGVVFRVRETKKTVNNTNIHILTVVDDTNFCVDVSIFDKGELAIKEGDVIKLKGEMRSFNNTKQIRTYPEKVEVQHSHALSGWWQQVDKSSFAPRELFDS